MTFSRNDEPEMGLSIKTATHPSRVHQKRKVVVTAASAGEDVGLLRVYAWIMETQKERSEDEAREQVVQHALVDQWGISDLRRLVEIKRTPSGRMVFRVDTERGSYAVKIYAPTRTKEAVERDIHLLRWMEGVDFPACRLLSTKNGEGYGRIDESYAYVYDWIEGKNPESTMETFEKLGDIMGRLHTIAARYPYPSTFSPAREREGLLGRAQEKGVSQRHIELLSSIRPMDHLPQGIIHTDIGPHNALERPDGEMVIIDWEDAGQGPMVIDIGWDLEQCLSNDAVFEIEKARAFLRAYQAHRSLTDEEKGYAYDAALFFAFLYWVDEQKEFGTRRIEWLANHRSEFEAVVG